VPQALLDANTLLRFVPQLLAEGQRDRAALALRQAVAAENGALTTSQALRVFETAREIDAAAATRAAQSALASPDLHEAKRAKLEGWLAEHAAELPPPVPVPTSEPAPTATAAADEPIPFEPAWGDDGVVELARFARTKLTGARPLRLDDEGLHLALEGDRTARVPWSKIQAVSVAIVSGLAAKPVLLIEPARELEHERRRGAQGRASCAATSTTRARCSASRAMRGARSRRSSAACSS
jgi:hypothetical protein